MLYSIMIDGLFILYTAIFQDQAQRRRSIKYLVVIDIKVLNRVLEELFLYVDIKRLLIDGKKYQFPFLPAI